MASLTDIAEEIRLAGRALGEFGAGLFNPTVRLGVTGLSGAGKTVFITALVHHLLHGGRLPVFEPLASGRIARARLEPQPDDAVPRFDYETHVRALTEERRWPESTSRISELRLVIDYQSARSGRDRTLTLDIVDYPGEWLLDLPLLATSYSQWSADTLRLSHSGPRALLASRWHKHLATLNPDGPENEQAALQAAQLFTEYLKACRDERYAMRLLPPGRFLMPGDLAGSPALTFAPLELSTAAPAAAGSLHAMMERRYEAYKDVVVRPFYREHFARLDRQIVLVDALAAFNAGPDAVKDLEGALAAILASFRTGAIDDRQRAVPPAHRPHPVRRDQGGSSASFEPRPAGALPCAHDRARRSSARNSPAQASMSSRSRRSGRRARRWWRVAATSLPPSRARRSRASGSGPTASTARPRSPRFRAICRTIPQCCSRTSPA